MTKRTPTATTPAVAHATRFLCAGLSVTWDDFAMAVLEELGDDAELTELKAMSRPFEVWHLFVTPVAGRRFLQRAFRLTSLVMSAYLPDAPARTSPEVLLQVQGELLQQARSAPSPPTEFADADCNAAERDRLVAELRAVEDRKVELLTRLAALGTASGPQCEVCGAGCCELVCELHRRPCCSQCSAVSRIPSRVAVGDVAEHTVCLPSVTALQAALEAPQLAVRDVSRLASQSAIWLDLAYEMRRVNCIRGIVAECTGTPAIEVLIPCGAMSDGCVIDDTVEQAHIHSCERCCKATMGVCAACGANVDASDSSSARFGWRCSDCLLWRHGACL